ncbi:MAG: TldD/PmbA family protein [Bacteriovoracaceae bacterium]
MLDKNIAADVLHEALAQGADFADIFVERKNIQNLTFNSSKVKDIQSGTDFGVGVRLFYGKKYLYGYTNSPQKNELLELTRTLAAQYKGEPSKKKLEGFQSSDYPFIGSFEDQSAPLDQKVAKLKQLDSLVREQGKHIAQVNISLNQYVQEVEIFDTDGLYASETRPYCRLASSAVARDGQLQTSGSWNPGARGGYSFIEELDLKWIAEYLGKKTHTILYADPCPAGNKPVVIDNGFGGVIFHEACGHLLETTSVQKKASVFWDKKEEFIAHEALSAVDDGTIDNLWGSLSIDDEGMPTQKTQLIKNGRLLNFLSDRMGELKTGHKRTGSARRQSYKYAPASRMRNTFIEAGPHKLEELIASMDDGIYAKSMGGGSVNPGTGEFNFAVEEGYLVKNGKIEKPVKGATLIGRGEDVMKKISMVGDKLEYSAGMCGSVSGAVPVTVGQPAVKVDEILVGGNG